MSATIIPFPARVPCEVVQLLAYTIAIDRVLCDQFPGRPAATREQLDSLIPERYRGRAALEAKIAARIAERTETEHGD